MNCRYSLPLLTILIGISARGAEPANLQPQLEPLRPLLGKTWRGEFKASTPDKPLVDVMRWERALNGKAVRILHSLNDGAYGGETIFRWDEAKQAVTYYYFTTAGFMTIGEAQLESGKWTTHETVSGAAGGVTQVRATSELKPDGTLLIKTEHLKDGQWQAGREVVYREAQSAEVIFK